MRRPVRVVVADRQPLFREAIARSVRQRAQLELVAEIGDGRAALSVIDERVPDVAVVGVDLPALDGRQVLNAVTRDALATRVVLIAGASRGAAVYDALEAGAAGWLRRDAPAGLLCAAISAAHAGEIRLTTDAQCAVAAEIRRRAARSSPVLNRHERRMLELVAEGRSTEEIAAVLGTTPGAVKSSLLRLFRRLDVPDRAAAVAKALRRGLMA